MGDNQTQPNAQVGQSSKASGVAGEVGVPHSSVDLHYFKGCKEPRGGPYSMRGSKAKDEGMAGVTRIVTPNKVRELQIARYREAESCPMNEFGEPNMGNPSVRFDEGRERVGHWPLAFQSILSRLLYDPASLWHGGGASPWRSSQTAAYLLRGTLGSSSEQIGSSAVGVRGVAGSTGYVPRPSLSWVALYLDSGFGYCTTLVNYAVDSRANGGKKEIAMRLFLTLVGLALAQVLATAQNSALTSTQEMNRLHQDSKAYIARLEDPMRDAYQKPQEVVKALNIKEGEVIADIGAGSGYFTVRLARPVRETGRIYAVDVSPDMIRHLNRRIRDLNLRNVVTVLCAPDDPLLADASVNRFFICDTWHHVGGHAKYLALVKRMLKPGGQVIMVDFKKAKTPVGPPMEIRIDRDDLVREIFSFTQRSSPDALYLVEAVSAGFASWAGAI